MMRFMRIRLRNWRNFSEVDVALQKRVFIVGANASGKSNLLDAFRFLRDLTVSGGGLQEAVNRRGGVTKLRNLAARADKDIVLYVELGEDDVVMWRYQVAFDKKRKNVDEPVLIQERIWRGEELVLDRPNDDDETDPARLSQTLLEQTFANQPFREVAEFLQSVHYSHIVPQLIRDPERSVGRQADPYGGDFLEQIAATDKRSQNARLRRILNALKIAIPQLSELELYRDDKGIPHLRGKYDHWRGRGAWQTEMEFSDGTLRLMGLLWAIQDGQGPLLLEEPELSLHPGVVRHLPQMLLNVQKERKQAYRQTIISTHSSEMLSDEGIAPDEVLLLKPTSEGTSVLLGAEVDEIWQELDAGFTIAEAVIPRTQPDNLTQLTLL